MKALRYGLPVKTAAGRCLPWAPADTQRTGGKDIHLVGKSISHLDNGLHRHHGVGAGHGRAKNHVERAATDFFADQLARQFAALMRPDIHHHHHLGTSRRA